MCVYLIALMSGKGAVLLNYSWIAVCVCVYMCVCGDLKPVASFFFFQHWCN